MYLSLLCYLNGYFFDFMDLELWMKSNMLRIMEGELKCLFYLGNFSYHVLICAEKKLFKGNEICDLFCTCILDFSLRAKTSTF